MAIAFPAGVAGNIHTESDNTWEFNGTAWDRLYSDEVYVQDTLPTTPRPITGNNWFNTENGRMYYYDTSGAWVQMGSAYQPTA